MRRRRLLVVEDDPDIREVLRLTFERETYDVSVAPDGESALEAMQRTVPDVVLLDVMLPGMDGVEVCRRMRRDDRLELVPVLMLTAKGEESDMVLGLGIGADDYVVKPARPRELVARVQAVLRRGQRERQGKQVKGSNGIEVDLERFVVTVDGSPVTLTPTELRVLELLVGRPGRVFTRRELLEHATGTLTASEERTVDAHVKALRKKLGEHGRFVETVRGVGYRMAEEGS